MTNEDLSVDENEQDSTLNDERESEEASDDLDSLFADSEDDAKDMPVSREEYENLKKGAQKLATELGRLKKEKVETKVEDKQEERVVSSTSPVMRNLYFNANPEAKEVWEEVEKEAKLLGKDPFELYEASSYFKGEAKARANAKTEEEANKQKIARPSSQTGSSKPDISKVKPEEVEKLTPAQKNEWVRAQARKEKEQID